MLCYCYSVSVMNNKINPLYHYTPLIPIFQITPYTGLMFVVYELCRRVWMYYNGYTLSLLKAEPHPLVDQTMKPFELWDLSDEGNSHWEGMFDDGQDWGMKSCWKCQNCINTLHIGLSWRNTNIFEFCIIPPHVLKWPSLGHFSGGMIQGRQSKPFLVEDKVLPI